MSKVTYINKRFQGSSLAIIRQAEAICQSYEAQGFDLTLRQLYYQFVSRGLIPNKDSEYKRLGSIINDARLAGYLDWEHIVDRTRTLERNSHWDSPGRLVHDAALAYDQDRWDDQEYRVEVWIEKDALKGVIEGVSRANDVPYFSCRGYTSQSEVWGAAQRLGSYIDKGQKVVVIHLGDHDPSGIDMSRDIEDRLSLFIAQDQLGVYYDDVEGGYDGLVEECKDTIAAGPGGEFDEPWLRIDRIALNYDQVQAYNPPPNPAKLTDARGAKYVQRFGPQSWELDALDPATLVGLIQGAINQWRDNDLYEAKVADVEAKREILTMASDRWDDVAAFLRTEAS